MKIIFHVASPDDLLLAGRAVKVAIDREETDTIVSFEGGSDFLVKRNKKSWTVWCASKQS